MAIDRGPWNALVDDDGSNLTGTVWNKDQIKTVILDPTDAAIVAAGAALGTWTNVPFSAANFLAGGAMTWTVGATSHNRYTVFGKTLIWTLWVQGATLSGTASNALLARLPGGYSGAAAGRGPVATAQLYDGIHQPGFCVVHSDPSIVIIQKNNEGNFTIPGPVYLRFTMTLEIA